MISIEGVRFSLKMFWDEFGILYSIGRGHPIAFLAEKRPTGFESSPPALASLSFSSYFITLASIPPRSCFLNLQPLYLHKRVIDADCSCIIRAAFVRIGYKRAVALSWSKAFSSPAALSIYLLPSLTTSLFFSLASFRLTMLVKALSLLVVSYYPVQCVVVGRIVSSCFGRPTPLFLRIILPNSNFPFRTH